MTTWGVDLGVRSVMLAGISELGELTYLGGLTLPTPKSVRNAPRETRWNELRALSDHVAIRFKSGDEVFVEEPPLAGRKDVRTALRLAQVAGVVIAASPAPAFLVEVSTWKKDVVGNGNADKDRVARWLAAVHPDWSAACQGDQNAVDATCIAIHGWRNRAAAPRGLDPLREALASR